MAIRQATEADLETIERLIRELAEYEKLTGEVVMDRQTLGRHLFGPRPYAEVLIAEEGGEPVGFALFFHNFSTFLGRPGIYLEDLFVVPERRGEGHGRHLLARLAEIAVERGCGRLEWAVLNWNTPAIGFYERLGARPNSDWTAYRLTGEALSELAGA
ncbi:MAG: GNAT family N-acetyltransferase [Candidatus Dormibacteraeota bacterium]|nr:GNAT family N-acetyltransferase [Candidatus Dormibacteraeota bacterium]